MKRLLNICIIILSFTLVCNAQYKISGKTFVQADVVGADTIPTILIKPITVFPEKVFKNNRQYVRYTRLVHNIKKAYPYAVIARNELQTMNDSLQHIVGERARRKYIKSYEKQMFFKYESQLRHLTISQGRILIKLVYREIGNTSYYLVKEYRGSFSAVFWQGIARLFGSNLKQSYDPKGEDADIERIVIMIENGLI